MNKAYVLGPLLLLSLSACKKDKAKDAPKDKPAQADPKGPVATAAPDAAAEVTPDQPDDPQTPPAPQGCPDFKPYAGGTAKVEVAGAETLTFESTELTSTSGDFGNASVTLGYRSPSGNERLAFEVPCTAGTSEGNLGNFQTNKGVWIVGKCTFVVGKHDATGLEGTLDCPQLTNIQDKDGGSVKVTGTFTATR